MSRYTKHDVNVAFHRPDVANGEPFWLWYCNCEPNIEHVDFASQEDATEDAAKHVHVDERD